MSPNVAPHRILHVPYTWKLHNHHTDGSAISCAFQHGRAGLNLACFRMVGGGGAYLCFWFSVYLLFLAPLFLLFLLLGGEGVMIFACRLLSMVSCLDYSRTVKSGATYCPKNSGFLRTTRHYNPQGRAHILTLWQPQIQFCLLVFLARSLIPCISLPCACYFLFQLNICTRMNRKTNK
jgi:hypothetical protein